MIAFTLRAAQPDATPYDREKVLGLMVFAYTGAGFPHGLRDECIAGAERRMDAPEVLPAGAARASWPGWAGRSCVSIELSRPGSLR